MNFAMIAKILIGMVTQAPALVADAKQLWAEVKGPQNAGPITSAEVDAAFNAAIEADTAATNAADTSLENAAKD